MMPIKYVIGDATNPPAPADASKDTVAIVQCCNNVGMYGAGFSGALSRRYPIVEESYRYWARTGYTLSGSKCPFELGSIYFLSIPSGTSEEYQKRETMVINIIGQRGVCSRENPHPIDYEALRKGLDQVEKCISLDAGLDMHGCFQPDPINIHMPRIGCGLAGGDWAIVEKIINETLIDKGVSVTVYDLEK